MPKVISDTTPDSHLSFGKKRIGTIRGYAKTKFGNSLIHALVNREEKRFDIIVKADTKQSDIDEFEKMWTMCKVLKAK